MSDKIERAVGGRYRSHFAELEEEIERREMEVLRNSGILESIDEILKPRPGDKVGYVVYCGTGGDQDKINEAQKMFKK